MKATLLTLVLLGVAGGGWVYYAQRPTADTVTQFRTVAIKRGDLLSTIGATGTVEPEEVVDVGRRSWVRSWNSAPIRTTRPS